MSAEPNAVGAVLIAGSSLFIAGAALAPEPARVFSAELQEHLEIVARHSLRWLAMNALMIASVIVTAGSLVLLAVLLASAGDGFRAPFCAAVYCFAGVLWVLSLTFRQSVIVGAAERAVEGGVEPAEWIEPLQRWTACCTGSTWWLPI
jgi:hypothetical protein